MNKISFINILKNSLKFFMKRKKYWLVPLIITLVALIVIAISTNGAALAPFVYSFL